MSSWFISLGTLHHGFGGRWKLGSLAPAEGFDEAVTKAQLDAIAPVPFSFSSLVQLDQGGSILGVSDVLDAEYTLSVGVFGNEPGKIAGFAFYLDTQRCSYWGDIVISVVASEIYDVDNKLPTIDQSNCNGLVLVEFNDTVEADETYTVAVTATGGGHSITRTFTINVVADPE